MKRRSLKKSIFRVRGRSLPFGDLTTNSIPSGDVSADGKSALPNRTKDVPLASQEVLHRESSDAKVSAAYDQNLLAQSIEKWRRGELGELSTLGISDIESHPDRARLALLAAVGNFACSQHDAGKRLVALAKSWGCDRITMARVLVAGTHSSLGRAALALGPGSARALKHFESAIVTSGGRPDSERLLALRLEYERRRMGLPRTDENRPHLGEGGTQALQMNSQLDELQKLFDTLTETITKQFKSQEALIIKSRQALEGFVRREMLNGVKQLEAFSNLRSILDGRPRLPEMHGWPISPDFALVIFDLVATSHYDLVVEFGSGSSTALLAKAICLRKQGQHNTTSTVQIAFEHLQEYAQRSQSLLASEGFDPSEVSIFLAPLVPYEARLGKTFQYYDCGPYLTTIASKLRSVPKPRILAVVDGPPGITGPMARYPALPCLLEHFPGAQLEIILDDHAREEENLTGKQWQDDLRTLDIPFVATELSLEKGALLISVNCQQPSLEVQ